MPGAPAEDVPAAAQLTYTWSQVSGPGTVSFASPDVTVTAASFSAPVMVGMESPISLLIYGFALWEAWRRNTRPVLKIDGPFQLAPAAAGAAKEQAVG